MEKRIGQNNSDGYLPKPANLGKSCIFWNRQDALTGCTFPKTEMEGRTSCEGMVDDVCIYLQTGKIPFSLSAEQRMQIKTTKPSLAKNRSIPPGDIEA